SMSNFLALFSVITLLFFLNSSFNFVHMELLGMSGTLALVAVGLNLDSLTFKPKIEFVITKFLRIFSCVYEHLIYTFFGIVIGCGELDHYELYTITFIVILFTTVNLVRLLTILLVSPILMHSSYEYNWRWGVVITWSGIKGVFNLLLAPDIYNLAEQKVDVPQMFILYVQVVSLLTMGINSYVMTQSARKLDLCVLSLPRQMALQNATQHIQEIVQNTISLSKGEKILTNVNWTLVEDKTRIEYIPSSHVSHKDMKMESTTDEALIEEARLHVATIQMSSFEKQRNNGILEIEAARILIGAAKSLISINYYFMFLYVLESTLKIIILKRKYFRQYWNTLEFFILVVGIIDIFCVYFVKLRRHNLALIQLTVIMGYLRIIRFLPLFKIIVPILVNIADVQIKKRLSLMYSITKGYIKSQEDAKLLIKQISVHESIYQDGLPTSCSVGSLPNQALPMRILLGAQWSTY
uniref:Solute carrier family 9 member C2 (putative) n=1 Tax=Macaca nemestrina TaxID=9545 RepID=A0A2K6E957_MACNE